MKLDNEINVRICKAIIEHMRRFKHSEEAILDTLKEKNYQIETILKADKLTEATRNWRNYKYKLFKNENK